MANKIAMAHGWEDAKTQIEEWTRDAQEARDGDDVAAAILDELRQAIAPGQLEPDEGLINALGAAKTAELFEVEGYDADGAKTDAFSAALADYNRGYKRAVRAAIERIEAEIKAA